MASLTHLLPFSRPNRHPKQKRGRYTSLSTTSASPSASDYDHDYASDSSSTSLDDLEKPHSPATPTTPSINPFRRRAHSRASAAYPSPPGRGCAPCTPKRFGRLLTLGLGGTIVLLILALTQLSLSSARAVASGKLGAFGSGSAAAPRPPVWESFPFLRRYHGGVRRLVPKADNVPEYPGAGVEVPVAGLPKPGDVGETDGLSNPGGFQRKREENGNEEKKIPMDLVDFEPYHRYGEGEWEGYAPAVPCFLDDADTIRVPGVKVYPGVVEGMPDPIFGSAEVLGLRDDVCFERYGRLGPYGLGYSKKEGGTGAQMGGDREGSEAVWEAGKVDWRNVSWGRAQERCWERNRHRFVQPTEQAASSEHGFQKMGTEKREAETPGSSKTTELTKKLPRTAVIIRTWWDYQYDEEDLLYLRALIAELSLNSGGEYTVHFLIHVKDDNAPIWADDDTYAAVLNASLPAEFAGMGTLWSERQMGLVYGGLAESFYRDLPVHGAYRSTFMPVQYFAHRHPEYDFFWHWEMDVRYTGHFYHLFDAVGRWAQRQPRKGLWERAARFYVPAVHGSWEDFVHMVRVQTEHGTNSKANLYSPAPAGPETPVWGPLYNPDDAIDLTDAPVPPTTYQADTYRWGVDEPADLITFNPLFDPSGTNWILAEDVTGYNTTSRLPPRRTAIITASRLSRRLLATMHAETWRRRHTMFSEMWPGSVALHHGLKAVFAPHPVAIDRRWPPDYLAATFNAGRAGAAGGARLSVFSDERQHHFVGTTWYYHAAFAGSLWRRWLGLVADGDGGEAFEREEREGVYREPGVGGEEVEVRRRVGGEGRMCLPGLLLHPVKEVEMVLEREEEGGEGGGDGEGEGEE